MNKKLKIYVGNGEIKVKWTQVSLKNVLKVKDPKLSTVLIDQNNVYAAVHGAIGEDRLQETCSFLLGNHHTVILTKSYGCSRKLRLAANIASVEASWYEITFFVPSECLTAKICCSWSSDKFAKRATCEFFLIRLYFCCLLDQDLKGQCR